MMSLRVSSAMRLAYLRALLGQRVSLLDTQPPGQIAAIITAVASTLQSGISEKLAIIIQSFALILAALGNAFYHSWELTLVTSCGLVLISICFFSTTPFVIKNMKQVEEMNINASSIASEALSSVRMVAACGAEGKMVRRYAGWITKSREKGMSLSHIIGIQKATSKFRISRATVAAHC
jgi:ATP-binding cassette subfamily B (MDR/TAP) protein 1